MATITTNVLCAAISRFRPMKITGAATIIATGYGFTRLACHVRRLVLNAVSDQLNLVIIGADVEPAFTVNCLQRELLTSVERSCSNPDIARHSPRT